MMALLSYPAPVAPDDRPRVTAYAEPHTRRRYSLDDYDQATPENQARMLEEFAEVGPLYVEPDLAEFLAFVLALRGVRYTPPAPDPAQLALFDEAARRETARERMRAAGRERGARRRAETERRFLDALRAAGRPASAQEVADALGCSRSHAYDTLREMVKAGRVAAAPHPCPTGGRPQLRYAPA